jgi:hypothetical protein
LRVFLKLPPKQGSCKEILLHLKLWATLGRPEV